MLYSKKSLYNTHLSLIYMILQSLSELQISSALNTALSNSNTVNKQKTLKWKASFHRNSNCCSQETHLFSLTHTPQIYLRKEHKENLELFSSHHKECQPYQIQICRATRVRRDSKTNPSRTSVKHLRSDRRLLFFNFLLLFIPALDGDSSLAFGWLATFEEFCWLKCVGTWRASPPWDAKLALHPPTTH